MTAREQHSRAEGASRCHRALVAPRTWRAGALAALALSAASCHREAEPPAPVRGPSAARAASAPASASASVAVAPASDKPLGWTQAGGSAARTSTTGETGPETSPAVVWSTPVAVNEVSEPVLSRIGGREAVLVGSGEEALALDLRSGKTLWSYKVGSLVDASLLVLGDTCWVFGLDSILLELSAADGTLRKAHEDIDFTLEAAPLTVAGLVVFEETSYSQEEKKSRIHAIDPATHLDKWRFDFMGGTGRMSSSDGQRVFVPSTTGVHAVGAADGQLAWEVAFPAQVRVCEPVVAGGRVVEAYGGYGPGTLACYDAATGKVLWTRQTEGRLAAGPTVTDDEIFIPIMQPAVVARYALADGAPHDPLVVPGRVDVRVVVAPHRIYWAADKTIGATDRATGQEAWRLDVDGSVSTLVVAGDMLLAVRFDGFLSAIESAPGGAAPATSASMATAAGAPAAASGPTPGGR